MRLHITCPNCGKPSYAFRTRQMSDLVTEIGYDCRNPACGACFVGSFEVLRYLRLPTFINPSVNVPLSPIVQKRQIAEAIARLRTVELPEGEMVEPAIRQLDIFSEASLDGT